MVATLTFPAPAILPAGVRFQNLWDKSGIKLMETFHHNYTM
jgi:hypothetical protein